MFREKHPIAWSYHRQTSRWPFNMHGLNAPDYETPAFKEDLDAEVIDLPEPSLPALALGEAIHARISCRRFLDSPVELTELGSLLHAAYGVLGSVELDWEFLERPVPSGGGLYPLELYILAQQVRNLSGGAYHYVPLGHRLEVVHHHPLPRLLTSEMFLGQPYLIEAAAIIIITAVVERSLWKYEDRGYRYILLEAGHVAQNLNLCASAMGLASLNLGGFFDEDVMRLLRLDLDREIVVYAVALGRSEPTDRGTLRRPSTDASPFRQY
jgi:SagB-type dehydrogenase family enzyme